MAADYDTLIRTFRPVFGNAKHLELANLYPDIVKFETKCARTRPDSYAGIAARKELEALKKHGVWPMTS